MTALELSHRDDEVDEGNHQQERKKNKLNHGGAPFRVIAGAAARVRFTAG